APIAERWRQPAALLFVAQSEGSVFSWLCARRARGPCRAMGTARYPYMTRNITRLVAVATLSAAAILAQGPLPEHGFGNGSNTPPDAATVVQRQVAFLTTLLTLTTGQVTQATTIFTTAINAITPLQTNIGTA